jgi:protein-disulfide isomerase/uncharacterized membrane protein
MSRTLRTLLASLLLAPALVAAATPGNENNLVPLLAGIATGWIVSGALIAWRPFAGVLAAAIMGTGVAFYLGSHHVAAAGASICSVNETFNCDAVNQSKYAELGGFPVAFLGMAFYLGVAVLSAVALIRPQTVPRAGNAILGLGVVGLGYCAFLFGASMTLGVYCLFCISLYGVTLLITLGGYLVARREDAPLLKATLSSLLFQDRSPALTIVATVFVVTIVGTKAIASTPSSHTAEGSAADPSAAVNVSSLYHAVKNPVALDGTEPVLGDPKAPFTVVEFADFQCPYCGKIAPELHALVQANPDVKLLFKNYPISSECNQNVGDPRHAFACKAAGAAECARKQGRFWELNHLMFSNQDNLDDDGIVFMAKQAELDVDALLACMKDPAIFDGIHADVASATQVEVDGTPSIFLKPGEADTWWKIDGGPEALDKVLAAKRSGEL